MPTEATIDTHRQNTHANLQQKKATAHRNKSQVFVKHSKANNSKAKRIKEAKNERS